MRPFHFRLVQITRPFVLVQLLIQLDIQLAAEVQVPLSLVYLQGLPELTAAEFLQSLVRQL